MKKSCLLTTRFALGALAALFSCAPASAEQLVELRKSSALPNALFAAAPPGPARRYLDGVAALMEQAIKERCTDYLVFSLDLDLYYLAFSGSPGESARQLDWLADAHKKYTAPETLKRGPLPELTDSCRSVQRQVDTLVVQPEYVRLRQEGAAVLHRNLQKLDTESKTATGAAGKRKDAKQRQGQISADN